MLDHYILVEYCLKPTLDLRLKNIMFELLAMCWLGWKVTYRDTIAMVIWPSWLIVEYVASDKVMFYIIAMPIDKITF